MMKKTVGLFLACVLTCSVLHASVEAVDVYGVDIALENKILAVCKKDLKKYTDLQQEFYSSPEKEGKIGIKVYKTQTSILNKINKLSDFSFAHVSTVFYQDGKFYTSIDLVEKKDAARRLPVSPKRVVKVIPPSTELTVLLKQWAQYDSQNGEAARLGTIDVKSKSCPIAHCTWGFDRNELKKYFPLFKAGAVKYKDSLMNIIAHGKDDEQRGAAVFLLAHLPDNKVLAHFLIEFTNDSSELVRNNAMRVLGAVLSKEAIADLDINPILRALDYPYTTDRNKASYVLLSMVSNNKTIHPLVIQKAGDNLIRLLRLKQPNNHEDAYRILKIVSHKNYAENDYAHWQQWVDSSKRALTH